MDFVHYTKLVRCCPSTKTQERTYKSCYLLGEYVFRTSYSLIQMKRFVTVNVIWLTFNIILCSLGVIVTSSAYANSDLLRSIVMQLLLDGVAYCAQQGVGMSDDRIRYS